MSTVTERHNLLFDVRRSIRYHNRRRAFFDRLSLSNSAVSLIAGSAVVASILGDKTVAAAVAGFVVTAFSTLDLVVGTAQKARLHADLARRFIDLEKRLVRATDTGAAELLALKEERLTIEADEPPVLRVLDVLCYNEQAKAMGYDKKYMARVGPLQRLLAQWWDVGVEQLSLGQS